MEHLGKEAQKQGQPSEVRKQEGLAGFASSFGNLRGGQGTPGIQRVSNRESCRDWGEV